MLTTYCEDGPCPVLRVPNITEHTALWSKYRRTGDVTLSLAQCEQRNDEEKNISHI